MDRRKFIKTVGLTAGATLLSGLGLAARLNCLTIKQIIK